jgi:ribosomal-protein-serine acetyltransferase
MPPKALVTPLVEPIRVGPDLRLDPVEISQARSIFDLVDADRARLDARLPWVKGTLTVADTLAFIEGSMQRTRRDGDGDWAIVATSEGRSEIVGVIGLHSFQPARHRTAIGYWISRRHEGHGLVTRSVAAVVDHLFRMGIHRAEIHVAIDNLRSRAIAGRVGFQFEGVSREAEWLHGEPVDLAIHARLSSDE